MNEDKKAEEIADQPEPMEWCDFLQEHPPGSIVRVIGAATKKGTFNNEWFELMAPELKLHCPEQTCNAYMFFRTESGGDTLNSKHWTNTYMIYYCRNCSKYWKTFTKAKKNESNNIER